MAKELTGGFDIAAQLSEEVSRKIFQMTYWTGGIPDFISKTNPLEPSEVTEVYFEVPWLEFVKVGDLPNSVVIGFQFLARVFPETIEFFSWVEVTMTAVIKSQPDGTRVIVIEFANVSNQFEFGPVLNDPIFANRVKPLIVTTLFQKLKTLPISPPVSADVKFFTFQEYVFPETVAKDNFLGVFVNKENTPLNPPAAFQRMLYIPTSKADYLSGIPADEMKIAIPKEVVMPLINQKLAEMGFASLPKQSPTDSSVTINELSMELQNGYIKVSGNATKEVDVIWDPDIDFEVRIGLRIENGILQSFVQRVDADLPWWIESMEFLLPVIGTVILNAVRGAMKSAISASVGGISQGALSVEIFNESSLPGTNGIVRVTNTGIVSISQKGLIIPGQVKTLFSARKGTEIPYAYGHKDSKEFHKKECEYQKAMSRKNVVRMINPLDALRKAYNGCAWCYPEYNVAQPGGVIFELFDPASETDFIGSIRGERLSEVTTGGLKVKPSFIILSDFAHLTKPDKWLELVPGKWKFTIETNDKSWKTECTINVPEKDDQGITYITATRGKPNCNHAFGKSPAFP